MIERDEVILSDLRVDGYWFEAVEGYKYLGSLLTAKRGVSAHN